MTEADKRELVRLQMLTRALERLTSARELCFAARQMFEDMGDWPMNGEAADCAARIHEAMRLVHEKISAYLRGKGR